MNMTLLDSIPRLCIISLFSRSSARITPRYLTLQDCRMYNLKAIVKLCSKVVHNPRIMLCKQVATSCSGYLVHRLYNLVITLLF